MLGWGGGGALAIRGSSCKEHGRKEDILSDRLPNPFAKIVPKGSGGASERTPPIRMLFQLFAPFCQHFVLGVGGPQGRPHQSRSLRNSQPLLPTLRVGGSGGLRAYPTNPGTIST